MKKFVKKSKYFVASVFVLGLVVSPFFTPAVQAMGDVWLIGGW